MKVFSRICLVFFSIIVLAVSLVICFALSGWIDLNMLKDFAESVFSNRIGGPVLYGVSAVLSIFSVICIFNPSSRDNSKEGILLENENGKLLISKDTIENISTAVIKNYNSVENSNTRVDVDNENKISIFITLSVYQEAIIKDLAAKIQENIKEEVKKSLDIDIKEVNIRVKNVSVKKENTVKE